MSLLNNYPSVGYFGLEKGIDKEEAPLEAIRQVNAMIKSLTNRIPSVDVVPWIANPTKKYVFLTELPEDLDMAENYIYDFNQFQSPRDRGYFQIQIFYKKQQHLERSSRRCLAFF